MSYDFISDGHLRVEVKSSALQFNAKNDSFYLNLNSVKKTNDEVRLVIFTPEGLYLHRWNGLWINQTGMKGKYLGHNIRIDASKGITCWKVALDHILNKGLGEEMSRASWEQFDKVIKMPDFATAKYFDGVPLINLSVNAQANYLAEWVRSYDGNTRDPIPAHCYNHKKRHAFNAAYDYLRNGVRVEVKYGKIRFNKANKRWCFQFIHILPQNYDELRLVF